MSSIFVNGSITPAGGQVTLSWRDMNMNFYESAPIRDWITLRPPYMSLEVKGQESDGNTFFLKKADGRYFPSITANNNNGDYTINFSSADIQFILSEHPNFTGVIPKDFFYWDNYIDSSGNYKSWSEMYPGATRYIDFDSASGFVQFQRIQISDPGVPVISQQNDGYYTVSWTPATASNGDNANIEYQVFSAEGSTIGSRTKGTSIRARIFEYGYSNGYQWGVRAYYPPAGVESFSGFSDWPSGPVFHRPYIDSPTLSASSSSGSALTLSWTGSAVHWTNGSVSYQIKKNDAVLVTTSATSYCFTEDAMKGWGSAPVKLVVIAVCSNPTNPDGGNPLTSGSNSVSFQFIESVVLNPPGVPVITQQNDGYYTVSWNPATLTRGDSTRIEYQVFTAEGTPIGPRTKSTSIRDRIFEYGYSNGYQWGVMAYYPPEGLEAFSGNSPWTDYPVFHRPYMDSPTLSASSNKGSVLTLSWTRSAPHWTDGSVSYQVKKNSVTLATTTATSYTFSENDMIGWGSAPVKLVVTAVCSNPTNPDGGSPLTSGSNAVSFQFVDPVTLTPPGAPVITQKDNLTFTLRWSPAKLNTAGDITYRVFNATDAVWCTDVLRETTAAATIPGFAKEYAFRIYAFALGREVRSGLTKVKFIWRRTRGSARLRMGGRWIDGDVYFKVGGVYRKCEIYVKENGKYKRCSFE